MGSCCCVGNLELQSIFKHAGEELVEAATTLLAEKHTATTTAKSTWVAESQTLKCKSFHLFLPYSTFSFSVFYGSNLMISDFIYRQLLA